MAPSTSPEAQKLLEALAAEHSIPELRRLAQEYASNQLSGTFLRAVVAPRDSGAGGVESYLSFHDFGEWRPGTRPIPATESWR